MLVPPGVRQIPTHPENMPNNHHWELFFLLPTQAPLVIVGKGHTKARRIQFRVTYYVCSTVHKALGETCPQIATLISSQQRKIPTVGKRPVVGPHQPSKALGQHNISDT